MHIAILALAPLAVFANKGYLPALLVAVLFNLRRDAAVALWRGHRLLVAGIALVCIWAAASLSFSPQHHVLQPVAVLALLPFGAVWVAGLARLSPEPRRRLEHTTLFAVLLMLVLYVEELLSGAFFTRLFSPGAFSVEIKVYEKVAAGIVLLTPLLWPLAVRLGRRSRQIGRAHV